MHSLILIDGSGSMQSRWAEAVASVNGYARGVKTADGAKTALAIFNNVNDFKVVREPTDAREWSDWHGHEPIGGTPLYDAVAKLIVYANNINDPKTVLIIITDGEENASQLYNKDTVKALLDTCRARGWEVQFLGVDFDNFAQAQSVGNKRGSTISTVQGQYVNTMGMMAAKSQNYAATGASMDWMESERDIAAGKDKPNGQSGSSGS